MTNSFILSFVKNGRATIIMQSQYIAQIQSKRTEILNDAIYRGGRFEVRTVNGFKAKEVLK